VVIVAEGAKERSGKPITSNYVKEVLDNGLGIPCRVTILGHVQRGGIPSAFDRYMSTIFGYTAVKELVRENASSESQLVVMRRNRVSCAPLMESVNKTKAIAAAIESRDFDAAKELRGASWEVMKNIYRTIILAEPREASERDNMRIGVMTCGHPAPGMNAAVRTVTRIGLDRDHTVLGIMDGIAGLAEGRVEELNWMQVENWFNMGGSKIGTNRKVPEHSDFYGIAKTIEDFKIQGIIMIGGWDGYESVCRIFQRREDFPAFNIPFVMIPASISNNLPGSELSIGSDTALNNIIEVIDKIKFSADSSRRAYVIEVMGKFCGYLALMSGLATGAETIYIPERGITLEGMKNEAEWLKNSFLNRRTQALIINNEKANKTYTTDFITSLLEEEGGDVFDVRKAILGPLQQGGEPTPFDRIQGTRLGYEGLELLLDLIEHGSHECKFLGFCGGHASVHDIREMSAMCTDEKQRPLCQWWEGLMEVAMLLARDPD
jgi:6-phosphofructokinase 1